MLVETLPPQRLFTLRILWVSIASSTLIFLLVLDMAHLPPQHPQPIMIPALAVAALSCLVVGIVLPRMVLRRQPRAGIGMYQTSAILGLAMTEAIALFGLVLGFLGFDLPVFLPFFVVAWLVFALRFPRATHPLGFLGPAIGQPQ